MTQPMTDTEDLLKRYDEAADKRWLPAMATQQKAAARKLDSVRYLRYQVEILEWRNDRSAASGASLPLGADPTKSD